MRFPLEDRLRGRNCVIVWYLNSVEVKTVVSQIRTLTSFEFLQGDYCENELLYIGLGFLYTCCVYGTILANVIAMLVTCACVCGGVCV